MVGNCVLQLRWSEILFYSNAKIQFCDHENDNFEYSYPHVNALIHIMFANCLISDRT